jgi:hypothetical protein
MYLLEVLALFRHLVVLNARPGSLDCEHVAPIAKCTAPCVVVRHTECPFPSFLNCERVDKHHLLRRRIPIVDCYRARKVRTSRTLRCDGQAKQPPFLQTLEASGQPRRRLSPARQEKLITT